MNRKEILENRRLHTLYTLNRAHSVFANSMIIDSELNMKEFLGMLPWRAKKAYDLVLQYENRLMLIERELIDLEERRKKWKIK